MQRVLPDRFHVIRLLNQMCLQTYQQIDPSMKNQRGTLAALRTNPANLTMDRFNKRERYLNQQPAIAAIYDFKQRIHRLLMKKHRTAKQCKRLIEYFLKVVERLKQSPFEYLKTLGRHSINGEKK